MGERKEGNALWSDFTRGYAQQPPLYVYSGGHDKEYWAYWAVSSPRYGPTTRIQKRKWSKNKMR